MKLKAHCAAVACQQIWDWRAQQPLLELHQRSLSRDNWPCVHWRPDDSAAFHMVTNNVHIYEQGTHFQQYR